MIPYGASLWDFWRFIRENDVTSTRWAEGDTRSSKGAGKASGTRESWWPRENTIKIIRLCHDRPGMTHPPTRVAWNRWILLLETRSISHGGFLMETTEGCLCNWAAPRLPSGHRCGTRIATDRVLLLPRLHARYDFSLAGSFVSRTLFKARNNLAEIR